MGGSRARPVPREYTFTNGRGSGESSQAGGALLHKPSGSALRTDGAAWVRRLGAALVFGKVRAALGIMRTVISGGGSLAPHLDDFFEARPSRPCPQPASSSS